MSMAGLARIDAGIRKLRANGGHYGDSNGGKPLHWMINKKQEDANRKAVCPSSAPADMKRAGRTSETSIPSPPPMKAAPIFPPSSARSPG
ncbi:hypothetical protein ACH4YN_34670 [Streptomyces griseofuscus]|uniref:hypothetical protein n=1 Tax=Streptomyces griseofuscus TaxID=146922 RepID=UPI0037A8F741